MAQIIDVERKANVLTRPAQSCHSLYHAINLAAGCPYECRYCYAQNFRSYPGRGKVLFYANSLEALHRELPRKRKKPGLVYFSTACEPFMPFERVLTTLYGVMQLLLENSVFVSISTKSRVPSKFLQLFSKYPKLVHVQVSMTMADDRVRQLLEPNAPPIPERLKTLRDLIDHGVQAKVRMDPLIPELTDTEESFVSLCGEIAQVGITNAIASYLYLRRGIHRRMAVRSGDWSFPEMSKRLYTHTIQKYCGKGNVAVPAPEYRKKKYAEMMKISADHGISLVLCRCKNPDLATKRCHPHPPPINDTSRQVRLFRE